MIQGFVFPVFREFLLSTLFTDLVVSSFSKYLPLSYCFNHLFLPKTPFFFLRLVFTTSAVMVVSRPSPSFPESRSMATSLPSLCPRHIFLIPLSRAHVLCSLSLASSLFPPCSQLCALLPVQFLYASSSGALPFLASQISQTPHVPSGTQHFFVFQMLFLLWPCFLENWGLSGLFLFIVTKANYSLCPNDSSS